jgi:hypothetical protein
MFEDECSNSGQRYIGEGRAEFDSPKGWAEGPARAEFDDAGKALIRLHVRRYHFEAEDQPFGIGGERNPCSRLLVRTDGGTLRAEGHILYGRTGSIDPLRGSGRPGSFVFRPLRSWFDCSAGTARYWVLPLLNYDSHYWRPWPERLAHPLRFASPARESSENQLLPQILLRGRVTAFEMEGEMGFIQPLQDSEERIYALRRGKTKSARTAIMVGPVGPKGIDWTDLESWFPFNIVRLLTLANGCEVGAPWIEFRSAEGTLVRRWHLRLGSPEFFDGLMIIDERLHGGTGTLLTQALKSDAFRRPHIQVALQNLIVAATRNLTMDDSFSHLSRTVDALCEDYGLKAPKPLLDSQNDATVGKILAHARSCILALPGDEVEREKLRRTADNVGRARRASPGFGEGVLALIERFKFHDAAVVGRFYDGADPARGVIEWCRQISACRNKVAHGGYINIEKHPIPDVFRWQRHMWDLGLRCTLKSLGYQGTYRTPLLVGTNAVELD